MTPTGTNLLGLVKHVASVEYGYLTECFGRDAGISTPWLADDAPDNADSWATADESREFIVSLYREAVSYTHLPCAPNTLLTDDGDFLAHVDLARLGTADRWADLAVMTLSFEWNYVGYNEADFWNAYGVEPDVRRIAYYRALWNAA